LELNPDKLLTTAEVGDILFNPQMSKLAKQKRIRRLIDKHGLPMQKIDKIYYITYNKLQAWNDNRTRS
tara:strand:+ start:4471 stop:4674 length:204 start_codon:yes stop_codon:yes gene_type:complete